jgi:hypothetical protein
MTAAVIAEAVVIVVLIVLIGCILQLHSSERERVARMTGEERRELLNRIQAPERIPLPAATFTDLPELEADESAAVGTITYDEDYGAEGDE